MLIDEAAFERVTEILVNNGTIQNFEEDTGKIKGRMMITLGELPEDLDIELDSKRKCYIFNGSFDFYDSIVGTALYVDPVESASGAWITPQKVDAEAPAKEWVEFFFETLISNIGPQGEFGIPMYTFLNDEADFTVVPTIPK